mgnify:FL=1
MEKYNLRIIKAKQMIGDADFIIIGAGSGLSSAAGLEYSGESFETNFKDFIKKYNFTDLYSASFYDFKTQEEKWAFFAKMIEVNRYNKTPLKLYEELYKIAKDKNYFILSTNVDGQFYNSGFDENKIFEVQGDYGYLQCENACHNKLYDNKELVHKWIENTKDCKIPSELVMKCPVCGGNMDMNLRKDANFVQDEKWYVQAERYKEFLKEAENKNVVLLEIGVGFNTPGIIRYPFEQMVKANDKIRLIRINKDYPMPMLDIRNKTVSFDENANKVIEDLEE